MFVVSVNKNDPLSSSDHQNCDKLCLVAHRKSSISNFCRFVAIKIEWNVPPYVIQRFINHLRKQYNSTLISLQNQELCKLVLVAWENFKAWHVQSMRKHAHFNINRKTERTVSFLNWIIKIAFFVSLSLCLFYNLEIIPVISLSSFQQFSYDSVFFCTVMICVKTDNIRAEGKTQCFFDGKLHASWANHKPSICLNFPNNWRVPLVNKTFLKLASMLQLERASCEQN